MKKLLIISVLLLVGCAYTDYHGVSESWEARPFAIKKVQRHSNSQDIFYFDCNIAEIEPLGNHSRMNSYPEIKSLSTLKKIQIDSDVFTNPLSASVALGPVVSMFPYSSIMEIHKQLMGFAKEYGYVEYNITDIREITWTFLPTYTLEVYFYSISPIPTHRRDTTRDRESDEFN